MPKKLVVRHLSAGTAASVAADSTEGGGAVADGSSPPQKSFNDEYSEAIAKYMSGVRGLKLLGQGVAQNHNDAAAAFLASSESAAAAAPTARRELVEGLTAATATPAAAIKAKDSSAAKVVSLNRPLGPTSHPGDSVGLSIIKLSKALACLLDCRKNAVCNSSFASCSLSIFIWHPSFTF